MRTVVAILGVLLSSSAAAQQSKPMPGFPDAPGKDTLLAKCFQCHGPGMWLDHRQGRRGWESVLYRMVGRGALWTEEEIGGMADYLGKVYGRAQKQSIRPLDLDRPGALATLEHDNPRHFAKVERILREAPQIPLLSLPGWLRTQFAADEVAAPFLIRTSYPAKARLSFVLDDTRYVASVVLATGKIP